MHNRSGLPLSAALFYFSPNWSVQRLWPADTDYTELGRTDDNGFTVPQGMQATLPAGITHGIERLKLFATAEPTRFDVLTLGPLDVARSVVRSGGNALEKLLASISGGSLVRELIPCGNTGDWVTAELELETSA